MKLKNQNIFLGYFIERKLYFFPADYKNDEIYIMKDYTIVPRPRLCSEFVVRAPESLLYTTMMSHAMKMIWLAWNNSPQVFDHTQNNEVPSVTMEI